MKLLQRLCFVFMSTILFFGTYDWFVVNQKVNFETHSVLQGDYYYWFDFQEDIDSDKNKQDIIDKTLILAQNYNVSLIKTVYKDNGIDKYLYGNFKEINNFLYSNEDFDFNKVDAVIALSNHPSSNEKKMYLLDQSKDYRVYSFGFLKDQGYLKNSIGISGSNEIDIYNFYNELKSIYPQYTMDLNIPEQNIQQSVSFYKTYMTEIIILIGLYIICVCFDISKRLKKVSVLRLQGYTYFKIIQVIYLKSFLLTILLGSLAYILLFLFMFREINVFNYGVVIRLAEIMAIQSLVCIGIFVLLCILLSLHFKYQTLKNKNLHKECMCVSFVLKIIIIILLIPQIVFSFKEINTVLEYYNYSGQMLEILSGYSVCEYKDGYGNMSKEEEQEMNVDYRELNNQGLLFFSRSYNPEPFDNVYDYIQMNENLVKLLLNEKTDNKTMVFYTRENDVESLLKETGYHSKRLETIDLLDLGYLISPYSQEHQPIHIDKNPVIIVMSVEDNKNVNFANNGFFIHGTQKEIERKLVELGYDEKMNVKSLDDVVKDIRTNMIYNQMHSIIKLVIYMIVSVVMSISTLLFYHYTYLKKNKILRTLGYPAFQIYRNIIVELILSYILMVIIAYSVSPPDSIIIMIGGYILLDIGVFILYCVLFLKSKFSR